VLCFLCNSERALQSEGGGRRICAAFGV